MLTPDHIKPYLLHEDKDLRRAAIQYFADCWSRDPDILPMILDACARYGDQEHVLGLSYGDHFLLTERALDGVLDHLARTENKDAISQLNRRVLARAPGDWIAARKEALLGHPRLQREIVPRLERRGDFAGWSGERLWEELQDFARRSEDKHDTGQIDLSYSDDLVDALARHDVPDAETVCRLLRSLEPEQGWLEIFLVDLAGARGIAQAIPALVAKFHIDTDYLLEQCKEALARIGDPEASRLLRAAYPAAEDHFKIFTSDSFGTIKHPESETALLELLEIEEDPTHRTILCMGLCDLFSERGVEVVRREIESGYDRFFTILEEHLLPVIKVLGIELPEAGRWEQERVEREQRQAARVAELEELGRRYEALKAQGIDPFAKLGREKTPVAQLGREQTPAARKPVPPLIAPVPRTAQRAGRNAPCPCGSGKKYKKCCGRS